MYKMTQIAREDECSAQCIYYIFQQYVFLVLLDPLSINQLTMDASTSFWPPLPPVTPDLGTGHEVQKYGGGGGGGPMKVSF